VTNEEREALVKQRQADCEYHKREKPRDTFIGTNPAVCAFCGITRAEYERQCPT
jgi:hypothetical protein